MSRLGIDTGGTFTDAVTPDGACLKLPSDPEDPSRVVREAAGRLAGNGPPEVLHGTTVATNALLERRTARVGVLVNRGFRDLLGIGRQARPELYALEPEQPWLPTSAELSREVPGRLGHRGEELEPFDDEAALRAGRALVRAGAQALAVVLLHAYADPAHERRAVEALRPLGVPVTASCALNPEFREVERGVTAVVNVALRPVVERYLARLEERLGSAARVLVMTSEGGLLPPRTVRTEPARLLVSGPAAGLVAARVMGRAAGARRALTLDMGGTSTDVALLPGRLPLVPSLEVAGLDVRLPAMDIHTVGAGGGSIVRRDAGGALQVGPQSAGADPGPAAYGRGDDLTVTDAHLLLGHIVPRFFAGGEDRLHPGRSERVATRTARRLSLAPRELLRGVLDLVNLSMTRALRVISIERGHDPRDDLLVAFGGAGGLHAVALARALGMRRVLVPGDAGVLSARGLLWAPPARTRSRSVLLDHVPSARERRRLLRDVVEELEAGFEAAGFPVAEARTDRWLDLRYRGQSFELQVPADGDPCAAFERQHERRYGFRATGRPIELVALRATIRLPQRPPRLPRAPAPRRRAPAPAGRTHPVVEGVRALPFHEGARLHAGDVVPGPAVVVQSTGTTLLDRRSRAVVHRTGGLLIEVA